MDAYTARFYDCYAIDLSDTIESRRSAMLPLIERSVARGARVLDVGAGSGRDVAAMLDLGLDAWGVEPNAAMRAKALERFPTLRGRLSDGRLPDLGRPFECLFDAVVCSAVLMHLDATQLPRALTALAAQLRSGAGVVVLLAVPELEAARLVGDRDGDGRCFHNHSPTLVGEYLRQTGFTLEYAAVNDAVLASTGTRWHMLAFRRLQSIAGGADA